MNDKYTNFPNPDDDTIARKLNHVAEQTHASNQFAAELEDQLRSAHQPKTGWLTQVSPVLRWAAVMALLALVLSWSIKTLVPAPQPALNSTPVTPILTTSTSSSDALPDEDATPVMQEGGYDWRQNKLYLSVPLPESPAQANVYLLKEEQPAAVDTALRIANVFGVEGEVFQVQGRMANQAGYMVTDGKQRVYVQSALEYAYYSDYGSYSYMNGAKDISDEQAASIIDAFMKSHGMDFQYKLENPSINPGMYYVLPTTPDGMPVYHDYNLPARLEFTMDESGQVILAASYQVDYEAVGAYGIRPVAEAFQQILDQANGLQNGVLEIARSAGLSEAGFWARSYPDNETITIYGQPASYPAAQPGGAPFVGIGQFTATGNTSGIESVDSSTYIEATGQFITENGIRSFSVDSWKVTDAMEIYPAGSLRQEADRILITAEDGSGEYVIEDAPSDLPLDLPPGSLVAVHGFLKDGQLNWDTIDYYPAGSGGGGGGGSGTGFYKLNLSGTPVAFPTPTPMPGTVPGNAEHIVKEGDTVQAIAELYGTTPEKIFQANNLQSGDVLTPGTVLVIPNVVILESTSGEYTVQEGDTLASIASNFGVAVGDLSQANGLDEQNLITVGQKLTIPGEGSNAAPFEYTVIEGDTCGSIASAFSISISSIISENNLTSDCTIVVGDVLKIPGNTSVPSLVGQRIERLRGILMVTIYKQADGNQRVEYGLFPKPDEAPFFFSTLEGSDVQKLEAYHNQPVDIWGTVTGVDQNGMPRIQIERYEIPYPSLQFQILKGKQNVAELEGERVALFTTSDGTTYVQLTSNGFPDITMLGEEGSDVLLQILAIPGDTFGGYPALRVFDGAMAVNPKDSQPTQLTGSADQPNIVEETLQPSMENYVPPTLTIEKVELVYYVPDPGTGRQRADGGPQYLQPAWRFYGHYSDGSEAEFLVQALKQEFLLPELEPYAGPG